MTSTPLFLSSKTANIAKADVPLCPCCDSPSKKERCNVQEHEYANTTDDVFHLKECLDCSTWYLDPRPAESALSIIYPENYYAYVLSADDLSNTDIKTEMSKSDEFMMALGKSATKNRLKPLETFIKMDGNTRWLDIGCSNGHLLEWLKEFYGGMKGVGLDLSERAVSMCRSRGFDAYVSRFEDFTLPEGMERFDMIHSSHVIEHVVSPKEYMEKAFELLKPGGICVYVTPNTATWEAKFFGRHWGGLHVPRHWAMLDAKSSKALGEKAGFEYLGAFYSNNPTFWVWTFHSMLQPVFGRAVADFFFPSDHRFVNSRLTTIARLTFFTFWDMANIIFTGQSSNMLCVFRKPPEST